MRWQHRTLGLLAPARFIALAQQNGTIIDLGDWVFLEATTLRSQSLRLEVTETMVMSNPDESRVILGEHQRDAGLSGERPAPL